MATYWPTPLFDTHKHQQAYLLHMQGESFARIGAILGVSRSRAHKLFQRAEELVMLYGETVFENARAGYKVTLSK